MLKILAIGATLAITVAPVTVSAEVLTEIEDFAFSFEGPFGAYDQNQLQRGLQIYTEVCAACHGLKQVPIRSLSEDGGPSMPEDQIRAYAAENFEVFDAELDDYRPAKPVDHFPANTDAGAPDLSMMAKARAGFSGPYGLGINQMFKGMGGAEYIASLMNGYRDAPECAPEDIDGSYNIAFANGGYPDSCLDEDGLPTVPGSWISMGPPLTDEGVEFADGSASDVANMSQDVAAFLMWTAEPKMMARKQAGFVGVLMLTILSVMLYLTNKRIWGPIKGKDND